MSLSDKLEEEVKEMLLPNEEVLFVAEQQRLVPGGSLVTPNKVYVTNRRCIWRNPRLLGLKADFIDVSYEDISNIRLKRGVFSTEIYLTSRFLSDEVKLPAIDKSEAKRLSTTIRKGMKGELPSQVVSRKKPTTLFEQPPPEKETPLQQLEKLGKLRDAGVITEEEFEAKKKELLSRI